MIEGEANRNLRSSHVPLFERLDQDTLHLLDSISKFEKHEPGQLLFRKGEVERVVLKHYHHTMTTLTASSTALRTIVCTGG